MKKRSVFVNDEAMTVEVSKAFYKKACIPGTPEFRVLREAMASCPGYSVSYKATGKTYNGLSLARMEEYIRTQPESEERLKEFEAVKVVSKAKGALYPLTKKWFFETYPEYKANEVSKKEQAELIKRSNGEEKSNVMDFPAEEIGA